MTENSGINAEGISTSTPQEQLVPQAKVNQISKDRFDSGYQKGLEAAQQAYQPAPQPQSQSGMSVEEYRSMVRQEIERERDAADQARQTRAQQEYAQNLGSTFDKNLSAAINKFEDLGPKASAVKWDKYLGTVHVVNKLSQDEASKLLYHLATNRKTLRDFELSAQDDFDNAMEEAREIVKSVHQNEIAESIELPREPLSKTRHTTSGIKSGELSDAELLRKWRR